MPNSGSMQESFIVKKTSPIIIGLLLAVSESLAENRGVLHEFYL